MIHNLIKGKQVILASASPRRKHIFDLIGINALQIPADIEEKNIYKQPSKLVKYHAGNKAEHVARKFPADCLVVGADTIVYQRKTILGKPKTVYQAAEHLNRLSADFHYVYTSVAVCYKNNTHLGVEKTKVSFTELSAQDIEEYISTKEPMDKAGAYGIQGYGSQFIRSISGCYFNVMGFPVSMFYNMLRKIL